MLKPLEVIVPNRFRDFDVYPIEKRQVELLMESMKADGHWGGLPARKVGDEYEIACGHHRVEAAKRVGLDKISLDVAKRTDAQMISIMVKENMTQRGNENFGAVLDSVGAVITQAVKECLSRTDQYASDHRDELKISIDTGGGVGWRTVVKNEKSITTAIAQKTVMVLKATGHYARVIEKGGAPPEIVALYENPRPITSPDIS